MIKTLIGKIKAILGINKVNTAEKIVIDTETTGLSPVEDELLQVSIISGDGEVLYNSYIKPVRHTSWEGAMRVNNITPEMVKNAPSIAEELPKIAKIITSAKTIIGYNAPFDLGFLKEIGCCPAPDTEIVDVMREFAPIYGEWNATREGYSWKKLTVCADYYNYDWSDTTAHNALADCFATLHCYKKMKERLSG